MARFLGGDRPVAIVDASARPRLDLELRVPVADMTRPVPRPAAPGPRAARDTGRSGSLLGELAARELPRPGPRHVAGHRGGAARGGAGAPLDDPVREQPRPLRAARQRLNELAGEPRSCAPTTGASRTAQRREIEEALKAGRLRGIVATSSLELGIDMGAVDLVLLVESPGSVSRGLQRVGRAGHRVGEVSKARIYPKHRGRPARGDRRRAAAWRPVPSRRCACRATRSTCSRSRSSAMCAVEPWRVDDLERVLRRAAGFRELSREVLVAVLDMLAGRYPSTDFAELRPRLVWDREADVVRGRGAPASWPSSPAARFPTAASTPCTSGPRARASASSTKRWSTRRRVGQTLTLGATTWRVVEITRDRVIVAPAPGRGGAASLLAGRRARPAEGARPRARRLRARARRASPGRGGGVAARAAVASTRSRPATSSTTSRSSAPRRVRSPATARSRSSASATSSATGECASCRPSARASTRPGPSRIEANLSREAGFEVQTLWSDDGIVLRFADAERAAGPAGCCFPSPRSSRTWSSSSSATRRSSRHSSGRTRRARCCCRAGGRGARTPLFVQRLRAQNLLAVARQFPSFPIVLETYRSCLQDVFDVAGLVELLRAIRDAGRARGGGGDLRGLALRALARVRVDRRLPLPGRYARGGAPRARLSRSIGRCSATCSARSVCAICSTRKRSTRSRKSSRALTEPGRAERPDALADLLRRLGDLGDDELAARCAEDAGAWLGELLAARRIARGADRRRGALDRRRGRRALPRRARRGAPRRPPRGAPRARARAPRADPAALRAHPRPLRSGAARAALRAPRVPGRGSPRRARARGRVLAGRVPSRRARARVVRRRGAAPDPAPHPHAPARRGGARRRARATRASSPPGTGSAPREAPERASTRRSRSSRPSRCPSRTSSG